jgi:hypothetical protein
MRLGQQIMMLPPNAPTIVLGRRSQGPYPNAQEAAILNKEVAASTVHAPISHGFITAAPVSLKSPTLRVTTIRS